MTSKISSIKLIRENIRQRNWFLVLSYLLIFLFLTIYAILFFNDNADSAVSLKETLSFSLPGIINGAGSPLLEAVIAVLAVLNAVTCFDYIHSKEKLDFYHSLPVKREHWFLVNYISGFIMFFIPYFSCCLLTIIFFLFRGSADFSLVSDCIYASGGAVLAFLLLYSVCVLSMILTGRTVAGLSLFFAVILCGVIEFIYSQDLKKAVTNWKSSLAAVAGTLLILLVMQFDVFSYDTYIPDESELEAMGIVPETFYSYFEYPLNPDEEGPGHIVYTEKYSSLLKFASETVEEQKNYHATEAPANLVSTLFCYRLNNGKTVYRKCLTDYDRTLEILDELCSDETYRKELFPVFQIDSESILSLSLSDVYGVPETVDLTADEKEELSRVLRNDTLSADLHSLADDLPIGKLSFQLAGDTDTAEDTGSTLYSTEYSVGNFLIYPGYTGTINWLSNHGMPLRSSIDPDDVLYIRIYLSEETLENGRLKDVTDLLDPSDLIPDTGITLSDRKEIETVLTYLKPLSSGLLGMQRYSFDYAEIQYNDNTSLSGAVFESAK